jgi:HK97 family phage major capsid protein
MNPEDFESLDLTKDAQERYYYGGPLSEGQRTLWGVPIVESETVTAGQAILGEWSKAVMWDRERATLQVSDSHADFFIRNMVAFLAEMRAAFGVIRPSAFCVVEMTSGS